ncbi:MAG: Na+/H+ antiporter subunit E [Acidimicrobiales bacterium]
MLHGGGYPAHGAVPATGGARDEHRGPAVVTAAQADEHRREVDVAKSERSTPRRAAPAARWGVEVLAWTLLTWGIWLLTLTAVGTEDLLVAGGCAIACGVAASAARRVYAGSWSPGVAELRPALLLPWAIVTDSIAVLSAPWRRAVDGAQIVEVDIDAVGTTARAAARRAIATLVVSATPGTVVLDARPDDGHLIVHRLRTPGPDLAERYAAR